MLTLAFCAFLIDTVALAQSKRELEKKKEKLNKEIAYTNQLLSQTKKNKSASMNQLVTLNRKITQRKELISTINSEISVVDTEMKQVSTDIENINSNLEKLKKQYAEMAYYAYKNQNTYSTIMFVLSAEDFNQAWKRMKYLRTLSDYRVQQRNLIIKLQDSLSGQKAALLNVKQNKVQLLAQEEKQKQQLDKEKKDQVLMLNNLTQREKKLRTDLKEKQRQEQVLAAKIESIIRREIQLAQEAARKKAASSVSADASKRKIESPASASSALTATPEAIRLSNDFESNKGSLPWPVEQGFISSRFGKHPHPVWRDVVLNNNGIDIKSSKGARARTVFEGKVLRVIMVMDKYAVLIQHGEYFTLYSNLNEVYVKAGDKVITKQVLGLVHTNEDDGKTELHLEIWKGSSKMDPESWLARR